MTSVVSRLRADNDHRERRGGDHAMTESIGLLPIAADLLPREVAAVRRGRTSRWVALVIVLAAVVGIGAAYFLATQSRSHAESALAAAQDRQTALQHQRAQYQDVVTTQAQAQALHDALARVMATDTPWAELLGQLDAAHGGVAFTDVTMTAVDPTATGTAVTTTPGAIGTLTVTGKAADKPTIAAFIDALSGVQGLANPFLSSVTAATDGGGFTFTAQVDVTKDLRTTVPNRWTPTTTTGGGK